MNKLNQKQKIKDQIKSNKNKNMMRKNRIIRNMI